MTIFSLICNVFMNKPTTLKNLRQNNSFKLNTYASIKSEKLHFRKGNMQTGPLPRVGLETKDLIRNKN